ncbi:MAG TPA: FAD-binding oxidoreductase [Aeromonadales bacterium]|nr:FAD-binding oxidoreductase [Aeromonadales bacterium]
MPLQQKNSQYVASYYAASINNNATYPQLKNEIETEVCIIGAGFTGLSTALHLAEKGVKVCVLEAEKVAWGASGRNGGHVGTGQRVSQQVLEKQFGFVMAKKLWGFSLEAVELVEDLIKKYQIQCDLKHGILHVAAKHNDIEEMKIRCDNLNRNYAYDKFSFIEKDEVDAMLGTDKFYGGQLDEGALHLHPLNYALGLAVAATRAGMQCFEQSKVTYYEEAEHITIHTEYGIVRAKQMVLACNGYLEKLEQKIARKIMPINNFVLATEPLDEELARSLIRDDVAVQDSLFVINYWKLSADNRLIFGGGENYSKRFPKDIKAFVKKYMLRIYPQLESTQIDYAWGGTLAITMNRLPDYGKLSENIYYAQGYSGHGVPTATFAGKLISEAITDNPERFMQLANLATPTFPGGTLLRWPSLVVGMLYHSLLDKL